MRVLVLAYACHPSKGSEDGLAYAWVEALAERHQLTVLTRRNNVRACRAAASSANITFCGVDGPAWILRVKQGDLGVYWYYPVWQALAFARARSLTRTNRFDVVHQLSLMSPSAGLLRFVAAPTVFGPFGGLQLPPKALVPMFSTSIQEWFRYIRVILKPVSPLWRWLHTGIDQLVAANRATLSALPGRLSADATVIIPGWAGPSTTQLQGTAEAETPPRHPSQESEVLRVLWTGRHVKWKGLDLAVRAFALAAKNLETWNIRAELVITGSGPETARIKRLTRRLSLVDRVRFRGWIGRTELATELALADMYLFTSVRETTGLALMEAMQNGLPSIAIDHAGPADVVGDGGAVLVPPGNDIPSTIRRLCFAIEAFGLDPELRSGFGCEGKSRVSHDLNWPSRVAAMSAAYERARARWRARTG